MAKKWSEVSQSEAFLALPPEQKEQARNQYFDQVVAPQIGDPSQVSVARQQFDSQTRITDLPTVNAEPPDFSDVTAQTDTTAERVRNPANDSAFARMVSGQAAPQPEGSALGRFLGQVGGREVLQGAYGLYGSLGGDAIDYAVLGPIDRKLGTNLGTGGRGYRQAASELADSMGMYKPQTGQDRIMSGVGEALTGTGLTLGIGGGLNALANVGRAAPAGSKIGNLLTAQPMLKGPAAGTATYAAPAVNRLADFLTMQPAVQAASTVASSGASGAVREAGGTQGQQLAAGLIGGISPSAVRTGGAAVASSALSRMAPEARREIAREARDRGIMLSPVQISDSRFLKWAQSMLRSVPFTGAQGRYQRQVTDFNRALASEIGEDATSIGPEVYARAKDRQSALFTELSERNSAKVDDSLVKSLSNIADSSRMAGAQVRDQVESAIDALYSQATTGPGGVVIPGPAYQAFDSQLNQIIKNGGPTAHFLGNVQTAVRRAMDKSITPADRAAWREVRREFGSRKAIAPLVARASEGNVPPAQVLGAVTSTNAGKEAMASGQRGNIGTLARIGQIMKEPPSSGTSERGFVGGLLGAGALVDPVTGALTAAGLNLLSRGLDSRALGQLMIRENPGMTMEQAMRIVQGATVPTAVSTQANAGDR